MVSVIARVTSIHCGLYVCKTLAAFQGFVMIGTYEMDCYDHL